MLLERRLAPMAGLEIAVWVFDIEHPGMVWANARAAPLWRADDPAALRARDFSDMSEATRSRLARYLEVFRAGGAVEETWTFYPHGVSTTVRCHCAGVELDDGRTAMMVLGVAEEARPEPDTLRGVEALRHTSVMVSLVDVEGAVLMQNPAALRAFGAASPVRAWFEPEAARTLLRRALDEGEHRAELLAATAEGARWHAVEARSTRDPVTGAAAVLIHQIDVTQRKEDERTIEQQRDRIAALSAPVLEVGERVLAAPMVGPLDRALGEALAARLLPQVAGQGAEAAILDLTGVTEVALGGLEALLRLAAALRLLGARVLVTGVPRELARAMCERGEGLAGVQVLRSLREGIAAARRGRRA